MMVAADDDPNKPLPACLMAAIEHRDAGKLTHHWTIGADGDDTAPLEVWWNRGPTNHQEELVIRQENTDEYADAILLTLGQVYDLIDALNKAVELG